MLKEEIKRELETIIKNVLGEDVINCFTDYTQYYNGSNEIQITFAIVPGSLPSNLISWFPSICTHYSIKCKHDENNQIINQQIIHYIVTIRNNIKIDEKCTEEWTEEIKKLLALYTKLIDSRDILFSELAKVRYLDYIEEK